MGAAHGLHCSRIDDSPLIYNQADTFTPDLLICRSEFAELELAKIAYPADFIQDKKVK